MEQRTTLFLSFLLIATFFYGCGKKHGAKLNAQNTASIEAKAETQAVDIKVADTDKIESIKDVDNAIVEAKEIQSSEAPTNNDSECDLVVDESKSKQNAMTICLQNITECNLIERESKETVTSQHPVNASDVSTECLTSSVEPTEVNVANELATTQSTSAVFYLLTKAKQMLNILLY